VEQLVRTGARVRVADSFETGSRRNLGTIRRKIQIMKADLLAQENCVKACTGVDVVMNLAASVAGVEYNSTHSSEMFVKNTRIGMNMLEAARLSQADEFLCVSSACVYSGNAAVPTAETQGFLDDPEASNLGYGWAKRVLEVQSRLYADQYGMKIAIVRPFNTYGPRDHFGSQYGHVIPSLVSRVLDGESPLRVWGNGQQTRSFIYVTDVVRAMLLAVEKYASADPINIGSSEEISIDELARMVANGFVEMREKIETSVGSLRSEMTAGFAATNKRVDVLNQKIAQLDTKLDQHRQETKDGFAGLHRVIGGMSHTLTDHEERIKSLEGE